LLPFYVKNMVIVNNAMHLFERDFPKEFNTQKKSHQNQMENKLFIK
jgi:hypothetical protein